VAGIAGALLIWGIFSRPETQIVQPPKPLVKIFTVSQRNFPIFVQTLGTVMTPGNIILSALQAGRVTEIDFTPGQTVSKGQVLIRLEDIQQRSAVLKTRAAAQEARLNDERFQKLFSQQAISQSDLDTASSQDQQAQAVLQAAEKALADTIIVAPFDGVIAATQPILGTIDSSGNSLNNVTEIAVGTYVNQGDPLVQLVSNDKMQVEYTLPGEYFPRVQLGQVVSMRIPAYPGQTFCGKVVYIAPSISSETDSFMLYASLNVKQHIPTAFQDLARRKVSETAGVTKFGNEDGDRAVQRSQGLKGEGYKMEPGLSVEVKHILIPDRWVLAVPGISVDSDMSNPYVYQVINQQLKKVYVQLGERRGSWVEIRSGIKVGAQVVRDNLDSLQEGMSVIPVSGQGSGGS